MLIKIHLTRHTKEILIISNTNASPSSTFAHVYALSRISTQMREAQKIRGRRRFAWIANCINKTCWNPKSDLTKAPFFKRKLNFRRWETRKEEEFSHFESRRRLAEHEASLNWGKSVCLCIVALYAENFRWRDYRRDVWSNTQYSDCFMSWRHFFSGLRFDDDLRHQSKCQSQWMSKSKLIFH